jgi:hypothetical protein
MNSFSVNEMRCSWVCSPLVSRSLSDSVGWCNSTGFSPRVLRKCVTQYQDLRELLTGPQISKLCFLFRFYSDRHLHTLIPWLPKTPALWSWLHFSDAFWPVFHFSKSSDLFPSEVKVASRLESLDGVLESSFLPWDCAGNSVLEQMYYGIINRHEENPPHNYKHIDTLASLSRPSLNDTLQRRAQSSQSFTQYRWPSVTLWSHPGQLDNSQRRPIKVLNSN